MRSFTPPISYCDVFLTEKFVKTACTSSRLDFDTAYGTRIICDDEEALDAISRLAAIQRGWHIAPNHPLQQSAGACRLSRGRSSGSPAAAELFVRCVRPSPSPTHKTPAGEAPKNPHSPSPIPHANTSLNSPPTHPELAISEITAPEHPRTRRSQHPLTTLRANPANRSEARRVRIPDRDRPPGDSNHISPTTRPKGPFRGSPSLFLTLAPIAIMVVVVCTR